MTNESAALVPIDDQVQYLPTKASVTEIITRATDVAVELAKIIEQQQLSVKIGNGRHIRVEAWKTVGLFCGYVVQTHELPDPDDGKGRKAKAIITRLSDGQIVSTATAECGTGGDGPWDTRPGYSQSSMAQTRASGKAFRNVLDWIVVLAGYQATPAEEMPPDGESRPVRSISPPQGPRTEADGVPQDAIEVGEWCEKHNMRWYLTEAMKANGFGLGHRPAAKGERFCDQPKGTKETITQRASGPAASTTIDATALRDEIDAGEPHPADLA